ncbi:hypothetical protein [Pelotomaculum propionicicum]|uniref:CBM-cenC domain-containing protein n=1 Tax=Pelotomaculum propionicicum TaxID=258475 RepID=A0A4Y7RUZ0_9FIRM|nr:hypothetical protein [Pelotomaculum propionicicum]NLI12208.1 hypothetical protein [Peptococcaceae bacterium]TEB12566.1 hypothetical protein Pmgp_00897 [Pelotomaculum propionicicum]
MPQLLVNPGFETGLLAPWTSTGIVNVLTAPPDAAHTGTKSVELDSDTTGASISQIVFFPILPGSSLRLSFFLRRDAGFSTDITATVTNFGIPVLTISIPAASNPEEEENEWAYYEGYSSPLPFGAPFGVTVTVSIAGVPKGDAQVVFDDIFLFPFF